MYARPTADAIEIPCVVYAAKSTEDRRGSLPDQTADCLAAIEHAGGRVVIAEYADESFSAFRRSRGPELADAMEHAEDLAREFGAAELWAQHSDRLARGDGRVARHVVEIGLWALKQDVAVRTVQDPETFRDLLYAVVTGQRNHEDSRRKGLAMTAGRRRAAARGDFIGWRPDGYLLEMELDATGHVTKRLAIDPARQEIIETIFRMALRGRPTGAIARKLNDQGWLTNPRRKDVTPKRWNTNHVDAVLRNPRYAGLAVFGGEIVARGYWPAYISEVQHQRLKRRLARYARNTRDKQPNPLETYLLSGLLRCGACGQPLYCTAGHKRKDGTRARRYVCASHDKDRHAARCSARRLGADMLEAMFVAGLRQLLSEGRDEQATVAPDPATVFDLATERAQLRDAAVADDAAAFGMSFERLLKRVAVQAATWDEEGASRRHIRQMEAVDRFHAWAEQEARGRTEISRAEAPKLNALLRGWFAGATVMTEDVSVTITATRRPAAGSLAAQPIKVEFDRVDWTLAACEHGGQRLRYEAWDDSEILGAFQAWASRHGRSPIWQEWRVAGATWPTSLTVKRHFGSWAEALRRAGLEPHIPATRHRFQRWSDAELIQAIVDWTEQHGHAPRWEEWLCAGENRPCSTTVTEHFGGWRAGIAAARLFVARSSEHQCSTEEPHAPRIASTSHRPTSSRLTESRT